MISYILHIVVQILAPSTETAINVQWLLKLFNISYIESFVPIWTEINITLVVFVLEMEAVSYNVLYSVMEWTSVSGE